MGMFAFFPWLNLRCPIHLDEFELFPLRKAPTSGTEKRIINQLLSAYKDLRGKPIRDATLLRRVSQSFLADLCEDDIAEAFILAELVAFCGLAKREFFGLGGLNYVNRTTFTFLVQRFKDTSDGVMIVSRRRDGTASNLMPASHLDIRRPFHAGTNGTVGIDEPLLRTLIQARVGGENWAAYKEAIKAFNRGNTDSNEVAEETEIVLVCGAFERLFDLRRGKEDDLAEAFLQAFPAVPTRDPRDCEHIKHYLRDKNRMKKAGSVRGLWIRDFFQVRGKPAHGRSSSELPSIWSPKEHLLLAAFIFPRIVKAKLAKEGFYKLTDEDLIDIALFEPLLCHPDLFRPEKYDDGSEEWPWNSIRSNFLFTWIEHKILDDRKHPEQDDVDSQNNPKINLK